MIGNKELLHHGTQIENAGQVQLPTGYSSKITHIGDCQLSGGDTIKNVLCVPAFKLQSFVCLQGDKRYELFCFFLSYILCISGLLVWKVKEIGREEDGLYTMTSVESQNILHS